MTTVEAFSRGTFELWLHAGMAQAVCFRSQAWELCHDFEHLLCIDKEFNFNRGEDGHQYEHERTSSIRGVFWKNTKANYLKKSLNLREPSLKWILEAELVEIILHALQGVSSAVTHLETLALSCSSWSNHRSDSSLWDRGGSTRALDKILCEFVYAGRIRCQLEEFICMYSDAVDQEHWNAQISNRQPDNKACKEKRRISRSSKSSANLACKKTTNHLHIDRSLNEELGGAGLIGQAFVAALKSILLGHSVGNNTLAASTANRRQQEVLPGSHELEKQVEGPLLSFVSQDISLLELYLHTSELRIQLEALAAICFLNISSNGSENTSVMVVGSAQKDKSDSAKEIDLNPVGVTKSNYVMSANNPSKFPKGAQLLTYLYSLLLEPDPLHMELLRFLFARTWQPYALFIHSWLFCATVMDPYLEFIVEKTENKVREVEHLPSFLAQVCTELVRAGQQLQVLLQLPETRSFAQQLGTLDCSEESLSSGHDKSAESPVEPCNDFSFFSTIFMPVLVFSKKNIEKLEFKREKRCWVMRSQFNALFRDLIKAMEMEKDLTKKRKSHLAGTVMDQTNESDMPAALASPKSKQDSKSEGSGAIIDFYWKEMECKSHTASQQCFYFDVESDQVLGLKTISTPKLQDWKDNGHILLEASSDQCLNGLEKSEAGTSSNTCDMGQEDLARNAESLISMELCKVVTDSYPLSQNQGHSLMNSDLDTPCSNESPMHVGKVVNHACKQEGQAAFQMSKAELHASRDESFIVDYHQGTNWPKSGLPKNPFLEQEGFHTFTPHPYACTYFTDTEVPWDLSSDSLSAFVLAPLGTQLSVGNPTYSMSVYQGFGQDVNVQPFSPHFSLTLANPQKTDKCVGVQTSTISRKSGTFLVEDTRRMELTPWSHDFSVAGGFSSGRLGGTHTPTNKKCTREESLPQSKDLIAAAEQNHFGTHKSLPIYADSVGREDEKAEDELSRELFGGATWETFLNTEPNKRQQHQEIFLEDFVGDNEIPVEVIVERCIVQEILSQYQCLSSFTVRLMQQKFNLQDHYMALRRYYFMEAGDWVDHFTTALSQYKHMPLEHQNKQMEFQAMLESALQNSSCEGDTYAERLHVIIDHNQAETMAHFFLDHSRLGAFDFLSLGYNVEWPLSLVLTQKVLKIYNVIFNFLLRIKLSSHALRDIWRHLKVMSHFLERRKGSTESQQQKRRLQVLQLFRQQIGHFVTAAQHYLQSQLLYAVWSRFISSLETQVKDLQDLEFVHCNYLEDALHECCLSVHMIGVKTCIDNAMQCLLDFRLNLKIAHQDVSKSKPMLISDQLFSEVLQLKSSFEAILRQLHLYHTKPEGQLRGPSKDFWRTVDFNGFLSNNCSNSGDSI